MTCDLASFKSIVAFAKEFNSKYKRLDSLILNAGLGANKFSKTVDGIETIIGMWLAKKEAWTVGDNVCLCLYV